MKVDGVDFTIVPITVFFSDPDGNGLMLHSRYAD